MRWTARASISYTVEPENAPNTAKVIHDYLHRRLETVTPNDKQIDYFASHNTHGKENDQVCLAIDKRK